MNNQDQQAAHLRPRHHMADQLRTAIEAGDLSPGQRLPSGRELADTYKTTRNTANEAIRILEGEGLVDVLHGKGVFVREHRPLMRLGGNRYSQRLREETGLSPFLLEAARQGWQAHVEGRTVERVQPPANIAERLQVPADRKSVIRRENWYFAHGQTVQIGITYIPWNIAKGTPLTKVGEPIPTGIYAYLETLGYTIRTIREEVTTRLPRYNETLQIPAGVPVIELLHTSISENGTPFDVTHFTIRADMMGLDYTMPVNSPEPEPIVRKRKASDLPELSRLLTKVYESDGYPVEGAADPEGWLTPENAIDAWVAVTDRLVGHILITTSFDEKAADLLHEHEEIDPRAVGVLGRLFVDPSARGKGVARQLLQACATYAQQKQLTLVGEVITKDTAAISLYEYLGLRRIGEIHHTLENGTSYPALVYTSPSSNEAEAASDRNYSPESADKPEHQPVVAAVVTSKHGVLLGKRNDGRPLWTFIAGEIEPGESPADAATREVKEETGLQVRTDAQEIGRRVHPRTGRTMIYLACRPVKKTDVFVGDPEELSEVRWINLEEAEELLPDMFQPVHEHLTREVH